MATLNKIMGDDFLTFVHKDVKFKLNATFKKGRKWFHTIKNVEKKTFATMRHEDLVKIIPDL